MDFPHSPKLFPYQDLQCSKDPPNIELVKNYCSELVRDMTGHLEIFDHLSFHGDPDQVGLTRIQVLEVVTLAPCTTLLERSLLPSSFLIILLNELKSSAPQGPTR